MATEDEVLRAYATMINTLDASRLEPFLPEDFHYASQTVIAEIESKQEYMEYITAKLSAIRHSGMQCWAEMGWLPYGFIGPCVILAQDRRDNLIGLVLATMDGERLKRLALCVVPPPRAARRSGEYPGKPPN